MLSLNLYFLIVTSPPPPPNHPHYHVAQLPIGGLRISNIRSKSKSEYPVTKLFENAQPLYLKREACIHIGYVIHVHSGVFTCIAHVLIKMFMGTRLSKDFRVSSSRNNQKRTAV